MAAWQARLNCAVCGHKRDTGIHLPALTGPRKGLPWGHEFKPIGRPSNSADETRPTHQGAGRRDGAQALRHQHQ